MKPAEDIEPWYFNQELANEYEETYAERYKKADRLEKALLRRTVESIGGVRSVLEVGCGTGHFTRWLDHLGLFVLGLDVSPVMLKEASMSAPSPSCPLIQADSSSLPFRDGTFDCVAFITSFEFMAHTKEKTLREAGRVARKGLLFGLVNRWGTKALGRRLGIGSKGSPYYEGAHFYSIGEMKELLDRCFGRRRYKLFSGSTLFPGPVTLERSRLPLGSFLALGVSLVE